MSNDAPLPNAPDSPEQRLSDLLRSLSRIPTAVDSSTSAGASGSAPPPADAASTDARARRRQERRQVQTKHAAMLDGLIRSLDIVAYAQMSILYYMDNSLARLLLRVIPHWLFFTPKPSAFPPPPRRRPYVLHICLANLTCVLLHLLLAAPAASETSRGYLHGGFLIDFVGERGPVSKVRLLAADIAVLLVQVVLLAVARDRERLRDAMGGAASTEGDASAEVGFSTGEQTTQDHDAEELGIRRDWVEDSSWLAEEDPLAGEESGGVEMAETVAQGGATRRQQHPLDRFYSGQFVVADLCIWDSLRASWKENSG